MATTAHPIRPPALRQGRRSLPGLFQALFFLPQRPLAETASVGPGGTVWASEPTPPRRTASSSSLGPRRRAALLPLREATLRAVPGWLPAPFAGVTMCSSTPSVRPVPGRRLHSSVPGPLLGLASPTPQVCALLVCAFLLRPPAGRRERGRRGQDSASSSAASLAQRPSPGQGLPGTFRKADQSLKSSDSSDKALRTREASLEHGTQLWGLPHAGLPGPSFLSLTAVTWRRNPLSRSVAASLSATHSFLEVVAK